MTASGFTNPIELADFLHDLYLKYLNSAMPLRGSLADERQQMLRRNGRLRQEPRIEFVPRYEEDCTVAEACRRLKLSGELADLSDCGLFPADRNLYEHQFRCLEAVIRHDKHMVVTTGTGSGKTECFLLPMLQALLTESAKWTPRNRPRAVRGLILYPLNALAEDQMVRLRTAIDSVDSTDDSGRHKNRRADVAGK